MISVKGRLLHVSNSRGLLYRHLAFFSIDMESGATKMITRLPMSGIKKILGYCRLFNRMFRLEPRCVGYLPDSYYVFSLVGKLWLIDADCGSVTELKGMRTGYGLISFCESKGKLYWGDYGDNSNYNEIKVYSLDKRLDLTTVYSFPPNSIRHIHSIIRDTDGFFVLTGDNEPQAGIYRANADWSEVKPWKNGKQKYRAVVGFPYKGGLLYATDSVETENHLWFIEANGTEHELGTINGSCIYGTETKDYFLFSTTVESHEGRGIRKILSNELGGGIKSKDVHIISVGKKDLKVRILKIYRKDIWPMKLFQYGRAPFAGGQNDANEGVWCYPIACVGTKGRSVLINL